MYCIPISKYYCTSIHKYLRILDSNLVQLIYLSAVNIIIVITVIISNYAEKKITILYLKLEFLKIEN